MGATRNKLSTEIGANKRLQEEAREQSAYICAFTYNVHLYNFNTTSSNLSRTEKLPV